MAKSNLTAKQKILKALNNGTLTVPQARSRFGIQNVSARVHELRVDGYGIKTLKRTGKNNQTKHYYQLGA